MVKAGAMARLHCTVALPGRLSKKTTVPLGGRYEGKSAVTVAAEAEHS